MFNESAGNTLPLSHHLPIHLSLPPLPPPLLNTISFINVFIAYCAIFLRTISQFKFWRQYFRWNILIFSNIQLFMQQNGKNINQYFNFFIYFFCVLNVICMKTEEKKGVEKRTNKCNIIAMECRNESIIDQERRRVEG